MLRTQVSGFFLCYIITWASSLSLPLDTPITESKETTKSEQKCFEYSLWTTLPGLIGSGEKIAGVCNIAADELVIGGKKGEDMEFPHMAHLGYDYSDEIKWQCAASLISEEYLLTAAHCLNDTNNVEVSYAQLGMGEPSNRRIIKIKERIPHPEYSRNKILNDVALLRLEETLKDDFSDSVRPACLETSKTWQTSKAIATGWGATNNSKFSVDLLKVVLPLVNHTQCKQTYAGSKRGFRGELDEETQICAGDYEKGTDTCFGDSGGPLQTIKEEPHCMYSIVGVTSFGDNWCGLTPSVYTKVANYIPWIESIVWPDKD